MYSPIDSLGFFSITKKVDIPEVILAIMPMKT